MLFHTPVLMHMCLPLYAWLCLEHHQKFYKEPMQKFYKASTFSNFNPQGAQFEWAKQRKQAGSTNASSVCWCTGCSEQQHILRLPRSLDKLQSSTTLTSTFAAQGTAGTTQLQGNHGFKTDTSLFAWFQARVLRCTCTVDVIAFLFCHVRVSPTA